MINTLLHGVDEAMFNGLFVTDRLGQALLGTLEQSFLGPPLASIAPKVVLLLVVRAAAIVHTAPGVGAVCRSRCHRTSWVPTKLSIFGPLVASWCRNVLSEAARNESTRMKVSVWLSRKAICVRRARRRKYTKVERSGQATTTQSGKVGKFTWCYETLCRMSILGLAV
jgi:hypothetical protein